MHDARDRNAGIWIEPTDRLYCAAYSSVASLVVMFSGYFRKTDGEIQEYAVTVNPTSDRAVTASTTFFGSGFLLSCVATLASGNANRGQCYVRAHIQRSTGASAIKLHNVVGGYVTDDYMPSFPYGFTEGPAEGRGMIRSITGTDPAAGAEISETVPTGARWRFYMIRTTLVADGTAANRVLSLAFDDGTTTFFQSGTPSNVTAGITQSISYAAVGQEDVTGTFSFTQCIPDTIFLMAGYRIKTATQSIQAGDNYGAPQYVVEEWIEA